MSDDRAPYDCGDPRCLRCQLHQFNRRLDLWSEVAQLLSKLPTEGLLEFRQALDTLIAERTDAA